MLPAYNESGAIGPLLEKIAATFRRVDGPASVLLVDDGSADGTAKKAREHAGQLRLDLTVETHETNRGLGEALRTGFARATEMAGEDGVVVGMDTDDTHDPSIIPDMLEKIDEGYDIVIASRYAKGGREVGLSPLRSFLSKGASTLLRTFLRVPGVRDYSCGYRAYRGSTLADGFRTFGDDLITESGFVASAEVLLKLAQLPSRVTEVPLVLRYDRKGGASKMNIVDTIRRYLVMVTAGRQAIRRPS